jgi:hypothetical protein
MRLYKASLQMEHKGIKMSDFSITTKLKQCGTSYWRSEFERIYVLAARKSRGVAQTEDGVNLMPKQSAGESSDWRGA